MLVLVCFFALLALQQQSGVGAFVCCSNKKLLQGSSGMVLRASSFKEPVMAIKEIEKKKTTSTFRFMAKPEVLSVFWSVCVHLLLFNSAIFMGNAFDIPTLASSTLNLDAVIVSSLWAIFASITGAMLKKLPVFKPIAHEVSWLVLRMLGRNSTKRQAFATALLLSSAAGLAEEVFFRGLCLQSIEMGLELTSFTSHFATPIALFVSSIVFGLAHAPLKGASPFVATFQGLVFGVSFIYSDYNLAVPILAHAVYSFVSTFFVWLEASRKSPLRQEVVLHELASPLVEKKMQLVELSLPLVDPLREEQRFSSYCLTVFSMLDFAHTGLIGEKELAVAIKLFYLGEILRAGTTSSSFFPQQQQQQQNPLSARQVIERYDNNKDLKISRFEFEKAMREGLYKWPEILDIL